MSPRSRNTPPPEIEPFITEITHALTVMATGEDDQEALYRAVDGAVRTAASLGHPATATSPWSKAPEVSFGEIIGSNIKALRDEAGWTQAQVAEAMTSLGFDWKRITMAQTEASSRRITFEELLGLAVVFAVPVVELLLPADAPGDSTVLGWHTCTMDRSMVEELLIGHGGVLGKGGLTWKSAARASGAPRGANDWRPAADLWRNREGSRSRK